jgi:choline dehydrogenase
MGENRRRVQYDDVIVGGVCGRRSRRASVGGRFARVALLEAGPDYAGLELTPEDLQNSYKMSLREHKWGFTAEAVPGRTIPYSRGPVTGGSFGATTWRRSPRRTEHRGRAERAR